LLQNPKIAQTSHLKWGKEKTVENKSELCIINIALAYSFNRPNLMFNFSNSTTIPPDYNKRYVQDSCSGI
jgi:hypothetical protein